MKEEGMSELVTARGAPAVGQLMFEWRSSLSLAKKLGLALGMAALTGLMAQVRIPLPGTPVPVTAQTFAVLLAGTLLGRGWGGISQAMYLGLGALGLPWFAGWSGGYGAIWGPTGGYLIGFIPAALFVGHFADSFLRSRRLPAFLAIMMVANFGLIHIPGLLHLRLWYQMVGGTKLGLSYLLMAGMVPFIAGDAIKVVAASAVASVVAPRR
jgi:biotin transport system substrate-specific component